MEFENQTTLDTLFPTVIQTSRIADAETMNRNLMNAIENIKATVPGTVPDAWSCSVYTTINTSNVLHEMEEFRELKDHIYTEAYKFANSLKFDTANHPLKITMCWVNIYGASHSQEIHHHSNNVFSGVYYVKAPPGCAEILFHSPMSDTMLEPPLIEVSSLNTLATGLETQAGHMVMFRSFLRHSVKANRTTDERISIAFNITM